MNICIKRVYRKDVFFIKRYSENVAFCNHLTEQGMRRILLTTSREQTEAYAHGLPNNTLQDYNSLKNVLNQKFGHNDL